MRLLIVDDNLDTATLLTHVLRSLASKIKVAGDRDQAAKIIQLDFKPDIIFIDYAMPGMSVRDFLTRTRPESQVVLMTGGVDADEIARSLGIRFVLRKPFDPVELTNLTATIARIGNAHASPARSPQRE